MFFRYELQARRAQASTPWDERLASRLYYLISNYGASPVWPLIWLGASIIAFSAIYLVTGFAAGYTSAGPWTDMLRALEISMSSVLRPFQTLADSGAGTATERLDLFDLLLGKYVDGSVDNVGLRVFSKFVSGVQSFISLVLLFLFALALRRRFQIN